MFTERRASILRAIVGEYIQTAVPVASEVIVRRYNIGLSSATIRNEMAHLEDEGYIIRPHISAGGIPSDKGYRYYVESLGEGVELSMGERLLISHLFHQVEMRLEEWAQLAAVVLSRMVNSVAVITFPKATRCRLKHLELIPIHDLLGLLVVILGEAKLKQQLLFFERMVTQEEMAAISGKLNLAYSGLTWHEIMEKVIDLSLIEAHVSEMVVEIMRVEDEGEYEEPFLYGLHHILSQPEFSDTLRMMGIMEILEGRSLPRIIPPDVLALDGVQVIIGGENHDEAMRECSVVVTRYGIQGEASGAVMVVGPKRMQYSRAIPTVRYLGSVLGDLLGGLYNRR